MPFSRTPSRRFQDAVASHQTRRKGPASPSSTCWPNDEPPVCRRCCCSERHSRASLTDATRRGIGVRVAAALARFRGLDPIAESSPGLARVDQSRALGGSSISCSFSVRMPSPRLPYSVALVPADPLDVVPCCHLVAGMTVADCCVRLASHWHAHPCEVWRVMARRGTVALCAVG